MKKYHTKNRCKYLLKLHIVFVVKYRKSILTGAIADDIKQFCMDVCKKNDVGVDMLNTDKDHIHLLVDVPPTLSPTSLVQYLKQETTWNIWRTHSNELKQHFLEETRILVRRILRMLYGRCLYPNHFGIH